MRRFFEMANVLLSGAIVAFALWAWPRLPDRIPLHFGFGGEPDRWGEPSAESWFTLPALAVALTLLMFWLPRFMARHPRWVNLPNGKRLSEFPGRARGPILELLAGFLALVQTEVLVIFGLIQFATWQAAMGEGSQGIMITVLLLALLSSPLFLVILFLKFPKAVARAERIRDGTTPPE